MHTTSTRFTIDKSNTLRLLDESLVNLVHLAFHIIDHYLQQQKNNKKFKFQSFLGCFSQTKNPETYRFVDQFRCQWMWRFVFDSELYAIIHLSLYLALKNINKTLQYCITSSFVILPLI